MFTEGQREEMRHVAAMIKTCLFRLQEEEAEKHLHELAALFGFDLVERVGE
jgi:hypothetical protein